MINGHWQALFDEGRQHWQHALSAGAAIRNSFSLTEVLRMVIVAVLTTVATTYTLTIRLDERQVQIKELMHHLIEDHAEFYRKLSAQDSTISRIESRQLDVRERLNKLDVKK